MRAVPYLQREGLGVHVTATAVRAVDLVVTRGRARVRRAAEEPVGPDGPAAALARLAAAAGLDGRAAHGHVDPAAAAARVLDVPAFDDPEDVRLWLDGQRTRAETPGTTAAAAVLPGLGDDVPLAADPFGTGPFAVGTARSPVALVVTAPVSAVDDAQATLAEAGLLPLRIGTGLVEAATPVLALAEFVGAVDPVADAVVDAAEPHGSAVVALADGRVLSARWVPGPPAAALDDLLAVEAPSAPVLVAGGEAAAALAACTDTLGVGGGRPAPLPDGLDPAYAYALGLALEAAEPALEGVDLLPPDARAQAEARLEKQTAQRALLAVALAVLALLLALEGAAALVGARLAAAEAATADQADEVAAVEAARADVARLRRDLAAARTSAGARTTAAAVLERVGQAVPEGVWLATLSLDDAGLLVTGYAVEGDGVRRLLAALEADGRLHDVRLVRTALLDPETTPGLPRPVATFEVRADVP